MCRWKKYSKDYSKDFQGRNKELEEREEELLYYELLLQYQWKQQTGLRLLLTPNNHLEKDMNQYFCDNVAAAPAAAAPAAAAAECLHYFPEN